MSLKKFLCKNFYFYSQLYDRKKYLTVKKIARSNKTAVFYAVQI